MTNSQKYNVEWICSAEQLLNPSFLVKWQKVVDQCGWSSVFQDPQFILNWLATKGKSLKVDPFFCVMDADDGMTVVIPACRYPGSWKTLWRRRLVLLGEPHLDFLDPVVSVRDPASIDWTVLWQRFISEVDALSCCETVCFFRVREFCSPKGAVPDSAECSSKLNLKGYESLAGFLKQKSQRHRGDIHRQKKRLENQGDLSLNVFGCHEVDDALCSLEKMISAYEQLHLEHRERFFKAPGTYEFYQGMIKELLREGIVHFSELRLNGMPISWHFGFFYRGVLHYYKPTYQVEYQVYSPGKVHLALLVELGIHEGWVAIDMGGGAERYKFQWADESVKLMQAEWKTSSVRAVVTNGTLNCIKRILSR